MGISRLYYRNRGMFLAILLVLGAAVFAAFGEVITEAAMIKTFPTLAGLTTAFFGFLYRNPWTYPVWTLLVALILFYSEPIRKFLSGRPAPDWTAAEVAKFLKDQFGYSLLDSEAEIEQAAANGDINVWGMTSDTRACVPIPNTCFAEGGLIVLRTSALDGVIEKHRKADHLVFGLGSNMIRCHGVIVHYRSEEILYATPQFSMTQIKSRRWRKRPIPKRERKDTLTLEYFDKTET